VWESSSVWSEQVMYVYICCVFNFRGVILICETCFVLLKHVSFVSRLPMCVPYCCVVQWCNSCLICDCNVWCHSVIGYVVIDLSWFLSQSYFRLLESSFEFFHAFFVLSGVRIHPVCAERKAATKTKQFCVVLYQWWYILVIIECYVRLLL